MGQVPGTLANINLTCPFIHHTWANIQHVYPHCLDVRLKDHISSDSLLGKLGINNIQTLLRYNRLRWFGHVVRNDGCINSITEFEVVGQRGRGRPKKTWKDTKGKSRKQNGVEKETQNKHRSHATHLKWVVTR